MAAQGVNRHAPSVSNDVLNCCSFGYPLRHPLPSTAAAGAPSCVLIYGSTHLFSPLNFIKDIPGGVHRGGLPPALAPHMPVIF